MTSKYGLIAFSIDRKSYIILGELYDKSIRENPDKISELNTELKYLCPWQVFRNNITNLEDIRYFQNKFKITSKKIGSVKDFTVFSSPFLYDLSTMTPVSSTLPKLLTYNDEDVCNKIAIMVPYKDPVLRGKLLEQAVNKNYKLFVVLGDSQGENKVNTATLSSRFLLKCSVPITNIVKNIYGDFPESLLDILEILKVMGEENTEINIFCSCHDLYGIQKSIKLWRAHNLISTKTNYFCV